MSIKPYDELPWWCQILWPWFGPPWYEQVEDLEAYLAAVWCALHLSAAERADLLAGNDAVAGDRGHPSCAEADAGQWERTGDLPGEDGRP
jgi:hypothetical protein